MNTLPQNPHPLSNLHVIDNLLVEACEWDAILDFLISQPFPEFEKQIAFTSPSSFTLQKLFKLIGSKSIVKLKWYFDPTKYLSSNGFDRNSNDWDA